MKPTTRKMIDNLRTVNYGSNRTKTARRLRLARKVMGRSTVKTAAIHLKQGGRGTNSYAKRILRG